MGEVGFHSSAEDGASIPGELVARLVVADRGSPDLDMAISSATGQWWMAHPDQDVAGPWTQSLDAALVLAAKVLPGWGWCMRTDDTGRCFANVFPGEPNVDRIFFDVYADTHPLALCAAVLKATAASAVGTPEA